MGPVEFYSNGLNLVQTGRILQQPVDECAGDLIRPSTSSPTLIKIFSITPGIAQFREINRIGDGRRETTNVEKDRRLRGHRFTPSAEGGMRQPLQ